MRKKLLLLLALVAVLTSGCIKADLKLDIKDDGSGTFTGVVAVNAKLFQQLGGLSALDPSATADAGSGDICQQALDSAKEDSNGAKVEPYKSGDFCGAKITAPFATIDEGIALFNGSADSGGGTTLEDVQIEKSGNGWTFNAKWNPSNDGSDSAAADAALTKQFLQGFSFVVRIHLPGGQVNQNADLIESDGTMVWNLDPTTARTLSATTDASAPVIKSKVITDAGKNVGASGSAASTAPGVATKKSSSKTWLYVVIGLVVVAAIAAFVLTKRNKTKAVPAMAGMPGAPPMAPGQMMAPGQPMTPPMGAPSAPVAAPPAAAHEPAPGAAAAPSPTEPQWDAARNAYIQWDPVNSRWMQYDQTAGAWKPIE